MTKPLSGPEVARQIGEQFPDAVAEFDETAVLVHSEKLLEVAQLLKQANQELCERIARLERNSSNSSKLYSVFTKK